MKWNSKEKRKSDRQSKKKFVNGGASLLLMSPVCGMRDYCEQSLADRIRDQWPS